MTTLFYGVMDVPYIDRQTVIDSSPNIIASFPDYEAANIMTRWDLARTQAFSPQRSSLAVLTQGKAW